MSACSLESCSNIPANFTFFQASPNVGLKVKMNVQCTSNNTPWIEKMQGKSDGEPSFVFFAPYPMESWSAKLFFLFLLIIEMTTLFSATSDALTYFIDPNRSLSCIHFFL